MDDFIDLGSPEYTILLHRETKVEAVWEHHDALLDDKDNAIRIRSKFLAGGTAFSTPLTVKEVLNRLQEAKATNIPGVYDD